MLITELLKKEQATDTDIMESAYGIANFTFDTIPTPEDAAQLRRLGNRLDELKAAKRAALRARVAAQQSREKLADCGHYTTEAMSTSQGTACPDCYDRMSDY